MSNVAIYDPGHPSERVVDYLVSVNTAAYEDRVGIDALINPDVSGLTENLPYWRHDSGSLRDMDSTEKADLDAEIQADLQAGARAGAKSVIVFSSASGTQLRAVVELLVRELNILRAEHGFADRTLAQAKQAYLDLIDEGAADG